MANETRNPLWAELADAPQWLRAKRRSKRQRSGILFEKRAAEHLAALGDLKHGQWLKYAEAHQPRRPLWCQPDFLLFDPSSSGPLWVIEAKLQYQAAAERKLRNLYGRLLTLIYPQRPLIYAQICKHLAYGAPEPTNDLLAERKASSYCVLHLPF